MTTLSTHIQQYLSSCADNKRLNAHTLKAYLIDLQQFLVFQQDASGQLERETVSQYISLLHKTYKPKTVKRKIASLKAFCNYLEYEGIIPASPFLKFKTKFQEPHILPRTIAFADVQHILRLAYTRLTEDNTTEYHIINQYILSLTLYSQRYNIILE